MDQKQSIDSHIFQIKDKELTEKDHQWTDQELYPQADDDLSCWQKIKQGSNTFFNKFVDCLQFDRIFMVDGEQRIDLKKCHKRYLQEFQQTYSERQLRFGYTFEFVLNEKIKEEKRKQKNFCTEWYRFVCCEGGNEMNEIDQAFKSQRQFHQLLKKKIMQRKEQYEEEKRKQEEKRKKEQQQEKQNVRITTENEISEKPPSEIVQHIQNIQIQTLEYDEQPSTKKEKKKKITEKMIITTQILEVRPSENVERNVFSYQNEYIEQKISGRGDKAKQPSKPTQYSHQNSQDFDFQDDHYSSLNKNQISKPKGTSSHSALKSNITEQQNQINRVSVKNITTTTYHQNIISKKTIKYVNQNIQDQLDDSNDLKNVEKRSKKVKKGRQAQEQNPQLQQNESPKANKNKNTLKVKKQTEQPQFIPEQRIQLQKSPKFQQQELLFTQPSNEDQIKKQRSPRKKGLNIEESPRKQHIQEEEQLQFQSKNKKRKAANSKQRQQEQIFVEEDDHNTISKKKSKKTPHVQEETQYYGLSNSTGMPIPSQKNTNSVEVNREYTEDHKVAKSKKQKKNINANTNDLQITQTIFQPKNSPQHISKTSYINKSEPIDEVQQLGAAKKKRKQKKQMRVEDFDQPAEVDLHNIIGNSTSTAQMSISQTNSIKNQDYDEENEPEEFRQAAKKRRVKKELKEKQSQQTFQMVFMDGNEDQSQDKRKTSEELGSSLVFMEGEEENKMKAEKKRKKPKVKKQEQQLEFDEVVNIEL